MEKCILLFTGMILYSMALFSSSSINDKPIKFLQNAIPLRSELILSETDCLLGKPYEINYMNFFLSLSDFYEKKTITLLDIKNNLCIGRFLSVGKGPGEVLMPIRTFTSGMNELYVYQPNSGYLYLLNIPEMKQKKKYYFENKPSYIRKIGNYFVGSGHFRNGRFHIYNDRGKFITSAGKYPFQGERMDARQRYSLYQGHICSTSNGNHFAIGSNFCDNLEFYEFKENQAILLKKYETYDVNIRSQIAEDTNLGYLWAYGTDNYCYMLYCGKTIKENNQRLTGGHWIIIFDWKGNHVKTYKTDMDIRTFCVDETKGIIYAVVLDDEYIIAQFKI